MKYKSLEKYNIIIKKLILSGNFSQLCEYIGKSAEALAKNANHLDNVLATLDIQQHSLGILGILCVLQYFILYFLQNK